MTQFRQIFTLLIILSISISIKAQESNTIIHTVNKGQTLYSISKLYGTTVEEIVKMNPESATTLYIGQQLCIPSKKEEPENKSVIKKDNNGTLFHTIQSGETLYRLSKLYGITTQEICDANPGLSTSNFRVGETIRIPRIAENAEINKAETKEEDSALQNENNDNKPQNTIEHRVKKGETLYRISKTYGVSTADIIATNPELKQNGLKKKIQRE